MWLVSWSEDLKQKNTKGGFFIKTIFSKRFSNDKCFYEDDDGFVISDGILLNKNELTRNFGYSLAEFIRNSKKTKPLFFHSFKGPFTGCFYSETNKTFISYGNQTGDASLFYYYDGSFFSVSSDFNLLIEHLRNNGKKLNFNPIAVNHMLSFGYLTEGNTFAKEIHMLEPGDYIMFHDGVLSTHTYHKFIYGQYNINDMNEAIDLVDEYFRCSVKLNFEKDKEYGYKSHLVDISGGLDSRMTNWVACDLGYTNIENICYAQSGSNEEKYASLVSQKLKNGYTFEPLENTEFIYDIEKIVRMNYGLAVYAGITGGERILATLNYNVLGLEHTGQLGDVILGYKAIPVKENGYIDTDSIAYSSIVKPILNNNKKNINGEEFAFYHRFFHGTLSTHYIRKHYTEVVSPFIDIDFAQLCFSISPSLRNNHKLYWEWIRKKYPEALSIPSTRGRESFRMKLYHILPTNIGRFIIRWFKRIGLTNLISDKKSMNPFDLWYANNPQMRDFIEDYYKEYIQLLEDYPQEKKQLEKVMGGDRVMDKLQVLTVLAAYKIYFS